MSERSTMSPVDLVDEALASVAARPARAVLTALGTVLGIAALVATVGLARTAGNQIVGRFDELAATRVEVTVNDRAPTGAPDDPTRQLPWNADDQLERLNGVVAAGLRADVDVGGRLVRSVPVDDPLGENEHDIPVVGVSAGLLGGVRGELATGTWFDPLHDERGERVVVLGQGAARRLNVNRVTDQPAIFIGEEAYVVIGILSDVVREPDLLNAVLIPAGTARDRFGTEFATSVHIDTEVGAAQLIGAQAPIALNPNQPSSLRAAVPPDPAATRGAVESDANALFLVLGGLSLLIGGLGIANVTLVSVLERVGEIGLRRAVGAARRHVAAQFLLESTLLGVVGGIMGASLGICTIVAVSVRQEWTPVLDPVLALAAPLVGAAVGLLAGAYPAWRAASFEPVDALRGGV